VSLTPSPDAIACFANLGPTGADKYGNGRGQVTVPCSIETKKGVRHDRALVLITKIPPIADWQSSTILGNAVATIEPSEFALPLAVRLAALNADEVRMCFAPTRVESSGGRRFILNGSPSFFSYGPIKGCDMSLAATDWRESADIPIVSEDTGAITYVYYDWFSGCESLITTKA